MQEARADYSEEHLTFACFDVGGRRYAIDVTQLREIVRWQPVTPLPQAPPLIEGVIDLRGAIVPVIDLGRALGGEPAAPAARSRITVCEVDGLVFGLVVEAAVEVMPVVASSLGDAPALATQAGYALARAMVRGAESEPIVVLALESLLERVYRSALPQARA